MTLPQFCLSFIESRWVWAGFKPPLPARNSSFSLARILVFTLGQTLVGAIMGWAIGVILGFIVHGTGPLVVFDGPFSWLIVLLAGFSACQGIVSYSLTALCWNQRAARLRANPALDVSLPPTRYPVLRFLLEIVYFVLLALITPAAIFLTVENLRGEILWRRELDRLAAQGERLEFRELLGPAIPPDQNAGAAAIFAPCFDYHLERVKTPSPGSPAEYWLRDQAVWRDTNALARLMERLGFPDSHRPREDSPSSSKPHTPKVNLAAWAEAYRSLLTDPKENDPSWVADLKLPPSANDPARVVLAGLSVATEPLAALCEASARPRSQFPVHYEEGFRCELGQLGVLRRSSLLLQRRCAAHLEIGETEAAFNDAECALRVAELLREEPILISQLVRMAQGAITTRTIWQGLAEHRWSDAQLAAFQERLAKIDYLSGAVSGFEGERAASIQTINNLISSIPSVARPFARGILRQNQIALERFQSQQITKIRVALSNTPQSGLAAVTTTASKSEDLKASSRFRRNQMMGLPTTASKSEDLIGRSPYNAFVWMMGLNFDGTATQTVRAHTMNRMAIVACALERYHLKHRVFPEKLDDLAPAFVPVPPLDPMNNQPFCYQRTDDGWFRLYSVGADGKDDGGMLKPEKNEPEKDWPWPVPTRPEKSLLF